MPGIVGPDSYPINDPQKPKNVNGRIVNMVPYPEIGGLDVPGKIGKANEMRVEKPTNVKAARPTTRKNEDWEAGDGGRTAAGRTGAAHGVAVERPGDPSRDGAPHQEEAPSGADPRVRRQGRSRQGARGDPQGARGVGEGTRDRARAEIARDRAAADPGRSDTPYPRRRDRRRRAAHGGRSDRHSHGRGEALSRLTAGRLRARLDGDGDPGPAGWRRQRVRLAGPRDQGRYRAPAGHAPAGPRDPRRLP